MVGGSSLQEAKKGNVSSTDKVKGKKRRGLGKLVFSEQRG
jgi:hypothetical protein